MQGYSGTYAINGTELTLQPTEGQWAERARLGVDGNGHPIYSAVREFEIRHQLSSMTDYNQLVSFYKQVSVTGTAVVDLPQFDGAGYIFKSYSGCTLSEPTIGAFFNEYAQDVVLKVLNIRVY